MPQKQKLHFPNLDGLRFIAAYLVIVHHTENIKYNMGIDNFYDLGFFKRCGKTGVVIFFVLSGFLISYLLLAELQKQERINLKRFFQKRINRIWPLYFIIITLSFFVLPYLSIFNYNNYQINEYGKQLSLFTFFLPNLSLILYYGLPYASKLWSIGVETQFYLIWPFIFKKIKNTSRNIILAAIIFFGVKYGIYIIMKMGFLKSDILYSFISGLNMDCFAIGGIFAWLKFTDHSLGKKLIHPIIELTTFTTLFLLIAFGIEIPFVNNEIYALLTGPLIFNLAFNSNNIIKLEFQWLKYLGKISYGLYMYHSIIIVLVIHGLNIKNIPLQYFLILAGTLILSSISFETVEKYFLQRNRTKNV